MLNIIHIDNGEYNQKCLPKNPLQIITKITNDYKDRNLKAIGVSNNNQFALFSSNNGIEIWSMKKCSLLRTTNIEKRYSNWFFQPHCGLFSESETKMLKQFDSIKSLPRVSDKKNDSQDHDWDTLALKDSKTNQNYGILFGWLEWKDQGWGYKKGKIKAIYIQMLNGNPMKEIQQFEFGPAGHDVEQLGFCINLNELGKQGVRPKREDVIQFRHHTGGGGGHALYIQGAKIFHVALLSDLWRKGCRPEDGSKLSSEKALESKPSVFTNNITEKKGKSGILDNCDIM